MHKHCIFQNKTHSSKFRSIHVASKEHISHFNTSTNQAKYQTSYQLNATDDLPSGIMPLAVEHKIHQHSSLSKKDQHGQDTATGCSSF